MAHYQHLMVKHYNTNIRHGHFKVGDLVLKKVTTATRDLTKGKLGLNWEGPYKIVGCYKRGTYHLEMLEGQRLHHPWGNTS